MCNQPWKQVSGGGDGMVSGKKDIIAQRVPNPASPGPIQAWSPVCLMDEGLAIGVL